MRGISLMQGSHVCYLEEEQRLQTLKHCKLGRLPWSTVSLDHYLGSLLDWITALDDSSFLVTPLGHFRAIFNSHPN